VKLHYRLVSTEPGWLTFRDQHGEFFLLARWRWDCIARGYWPGLPGRRA
jgi:hypothetical protein